MVHTLRRLGYGLPSNLSGTHHCTLLSALFSRLMYFDGMLGRLLHTFGSLRMIKLVVLEIHGCCRHPHEISDSAAYRHASVGRRLSDGGCRRLSEKRVSLRLYSWPTLCLVARMAAHIAVRATHKSLQITLYQIQTTSNHCTSNDVLTCDLYFLNPYQIPGG